MTKEPKLPPSDKIPVILKTAEYEILLSVPLEIGKGNLLEGMKEIRKDMKDALIYYKDDITCQEN